MLQIKLYNNENILICTAVVYTDYITSFYSIKVMSNDNVYKTLKKSIFQTVALIKDFFVVE